MEKIIIAVDGHSSCGKSTIAKAIAKTAGYKYIDSGAMYRAVTLYCLKKNLFNKNGEVNVSKLKREIGNIKIDFRNDVQTGASDTYLNGEKVENEIRSMEVASKVSPVSTIDFVREEMVRQQRQMGEKKGIVMDGRDIGTTVFPNAELKLFITARPEVRAQRRLKELKEKGDDKVSLEEVLKNIEERDFIDSTRKASPLRKAKDAVVLDNSDMTIGEQNKWVFEQYDKRRNR